MIPAPITIFRTNYTMYGSGNGEWTSIYVPDHFSFLHVTIYGAGGNGGNGHSDIAGNVRGGGGGGGNGARSSIFLPLYGGLQRTFFINLAGAGSGLVSYLSLLPEATQGWLLLSANPGGNGSNSTGSAGGLGGLAAAASSDTGALLHSLGMTSYRAGTAGNSGASTNANAASVTFGGIGMFTCQGPGGAGVTATSRTGGGLIGGGTCPTIPVTSGGLSGVDGIYSLDGPMPYSICGNGGSSNNSSPGGDGGDGAPGCGAGGGAGGTTGGTGGTGGCAFATISMG